MATTWPLLCVLLQAVPAGTVAPTNEASTQPVATDKTAIQTLLDNLASDSAELRKQARHQLLQISRSELMAVRDLVAEGKGRHPSQKQALYEIVCHVFLATEPYDSVPDTSFFGIYLYRPVTVGDRVGLAFQSRLIGFPAYASLEDGDIILSVVERPEIDFLAVSPLETARRSFKPGETVHLQILRDDRLMTVPLTLAKSPVWRGQGAEERMLREQEAAEFWRTHFESLWNRAD